MSEMLGNQYFMARKFFEAEKVLSECTISDPDNKLIKKKLIICYVETGKTENAINLFRSLIRDDVDIILSTNPIHDDCPCPELIYDYEKKLPHHTLTKNDLITLGILWLFCDFKKSLEKFKEAFQKDSNDEDLNSILAILRAKENELQNKDKNPYIS